MHGEESKRLISPVNDPVHLKMMLIGDTGVGKTSLKMTWETREFPTLYEPTVLDASTQEIQILNGTKYIIRLWDTAGHDDLER